MILTEVPNFDTLNHGGAKCSFCGMHKQADVPVFRTNVHIEREGWIEVCGKCLRKAGKTVGLITKTQADELRRQLDLALEHEEFLRSELEESRTTVGSLAGELARCAEDQAAKQKRAYEKGWQDGLNQENVPEATSA